MRHRGRRAEVRQLRRVVGPQEHLDRFMQAYALERAKLEARKRGYSVTEQPLEDGSIRLRIVEAR